MNEPSEEEIEAAARVAYEQSCNAEAVACEPWDQFEHADTWRSEVAIVLRAAAAVRDKNTRTDGDRLDSLVAAVRTALTLLNEQAVASAVAALFEGLRDAGVIAE